MRLLALGLAAAALAAPLAGTSAAAADCVPGYAGTNVCVEYTCNDHHCINRTYTAVYTTCRHPFDVLCRRVDLRGSTVG